MTSKRQPLKTFRRSEDGTATVEFVIWLPILFGVLMFAADATLLLHQQTLLYDISRDGARMVATGSYSTDSAEAALNSRGPDADSYKAEIAVDGGFVTATTRVNFADILAFGDAFFKDAVITAEVTMWVEGEVVSESSASPEADG